MTQKKEKKIYKLDFYSCANVKHNQYVIIKVDKS